MSEEREGDDRTVQHTTEEAREEDKGRTKACGDVSVCRAETDLEAKEKVQ